MGARRTTRSEPCVGRPDGIVQEEWEAELGIFPGLVVVLIFFGVFDASVAQASSEASFARVLGAEACDFILRARPTSCADVTSVAARPYSSQDGAGQPSPRVPVRGREE